MKIRSRFCDAAHCVEVEYDVNGQVIVTSSNDTEQALCFTIEEWRAFVDGVYAGDFDSIFESARAEKEEEKTNG